MALPDEILACLSRHQQELVSILGDWKSRIESQHELDVAAASAVAGIRQYRDSLHVEPMPSRLPLPILAEPMQQVPMPSQEPSVLIEQELTQEIGQDLNIVFESHEKQQDVACQEFEAFPEKDGLDTGVIHRWKHLYTKLFATLHGEQQFYVNDRWSQQYQHGGDQDLEDFAVVILREALEEKQHRIFDATSLEVGGRSSLEYGCIPRIHPNSPRRLAWIFLSLLMCCVEFVVVPIEVAHTLPETPAFLLLTWTGLFFWTIDIALNFLTGVFVQDILHMDLRTIAKDYATSWFPLDITIVSLEWMSAVASSSLGMDASAVSIFKIMRVFRLVKLLRIGKLYKVLQDVMLHQLSYLGDMVVMLKLCVMYLGGLHLVGCIWFLIRKESDTSHDLMLTIGIEPLDVYSAYILSLEWALQFLLGEYPDLRVNNSIEMTVGFLLQYMGMLALAVLISRIVVLVQTLINHDELDLQAACSSYLLSYSISPMLSKITTKSLGIHHAGDRMNQKMSKEANFLRKMPRSLQINLREEAFGPILLQRRFFGEFQVLHHAAFRHLCFEALTELVVKKGDVVFGMGQVAASMKFVRSGQLTYSLSKLWSNSTTRGSVTSMLVSSLSAMQGAHQVGEGDALSEAVLWMSWFHTGKLLASAYCLMVDLPADKFADVISCYKKPHKTAVGYAHKFVSQQRKNPAACTDLSNFIVEFSDLDDWMPSEADFGDHFIFLSHFKAEAGTEAVLLQEALKKLIKEDKAHAAYRFNDPVFLDSDNLVDLTKLTDHLNRTHNLVLLLTPGVFERPWCLVEIVTAVRRNINIVPVEIFRPGLKYTYPTDDFYMQFRTGKFLRPADHAVLQSNNVSLEDAENAIRQVFTKIATAFSPHKSYDIRTTEINRILHRCITSQSTQATSASAAAPRTSASNATEAVKTSVRKSKSRVSSVISLPIRRRSTLF